MDKWTLKAHQLASRIEWIRAKEMAGRRKRDQPHEFYDPHAATELGELIIKTMRPKKGNPK